ncbi:hypothetical protein EZV73_08240 [Acidaminobacter sp. JC074]|uniref:hypothetical protein n=1 Tax=Acidaminobacter sp. JC074 TaxID=2530199 RepID=UPI001F0DE2A2|nr:hypothetical protein [Acidaminobacter sp. JC074]MCH4887558.1 hypothetical protein [Acidaminobacter sp. JC074]
MKNNKFNLFIGCLLPIYIVIFAATILMFTFSDGMDENVLLMLVPFHIFVMFISIYLIILYVVYFDQNKALTGNQKGIWFVIHFATFGLSYPLFWWHHLSKWETITAKHILRHFGIVKD